jgi:hypothetical protein
MNVIGDFEGVFAARRGGMWDARNRDELRSQLPPHVNLSWDLALSLKKIFTPISHEENSTDGNEYKYSTP